VPGKARDSAQALTGPTTPEGARVQVHNAPGAEVGPGQIATWGTANEDEVEAFGFEWSWPGTTSDTNAVSPTTARTIAVLVNRYVDVGIIGPPPHTFVTTRLYLSGDEAPLIGDLFAETIVEARVVSEDAAAASAVKMALAAWTKGTSALLLAVRAVARTQGVEETLLDEWRTSLRDRRHLQRGGAAGRLSARSARDLPSRIPRAHGRREPRARPRRDQQDIRS
jgi:hypothetical protein